LLDGRSSGQIEKGRRSLDLIRRYTTSSGISFKDEKQSEQFQRDNEAERIVFEERYYLVAAQAQRIIDRAKQPQVITQQQVNNSTENTQANVAKRRNKPKLPEIKLPEFNGEYTKWLFFKNSFKTTVQSNTRLQISA